jgi:hypothetical protein
VGHLLEAAGLAGGVLLGAPLASACAGSDSDQATTSPSASAAPTKNGHIVSGVSDGSAKDGRDAGTALLPAPWIAMQRQLFDAQPHQRMRRRLTRDPVVEPVVALCRRGGAWAAARVVRRLLRRQRVDEGEAQIDPFPELGIVRDAGWVDKDRRTHRPAGEVHDPSVRPAEGIIVTFTTNAHHERPADHTGEHVAVRQKDERAEHRPLIDVVAPGNRRA